MTTTLLTNGFKFEGNDDQILGMYELLRNIEGKKVVKFEFPPMGETSTIYVALEPFGQEDIQAWEERFKNTKLREEVTTPPQPNSGD